MWKVKREMLFEKTLPEARWSCKRYQPPVPKPKPEAKREWRLKQPA